MWSTIIKKNTPDQEADADCFVLVHVIPAANEFVQGALARLASALAR
jgi:hypothetical protein